MLSLIIPVYNEEGAVEDIIRRADSVLHDDYEIIVVDDGSIDATPGILKKIDLPNVRIVRHHKNQGNGAAIKTGIEHSAGDWIATIDADNTYHPENIPSLFSTAEARQADMIVGFREDLTKGPFLHRNARNFLRKWAELWSGQTIADINSGLRICKTELIKRYLDLYPNRFSLHIALMVSAGLDNATILYEPIPYGPRIGVSKLSPGFRGVGNFVKFLVLIPLTWWRHKHLKKVEKISFSMPKALDV